jgi:succinate dehydrogenase flavin-adding protein (antitoxin of CptAB toxin-antitoxin module)
MATDLPARIGRPSKAEHVLTSEMLDMIGTLLVDGNCKETVAAFLGITRMTWWNWEQRGEREPDSIFGEFLYVVEKAQAAAEIGMLRSIRFGAPGWQSSAWIMERRFPQRWGRRVEIMVRSEAEKLAARYGKTVEQVLRDAEEVAAEAGGV